MKKIGALLVFLTFAQSALAFQSGDKYQCFDSVSGETYFLKIMDIGDEEAFVQISGPQGKRFYPAERVILDVNSTGAQFGMLDNNGSFVEGISLEKEVSVRGRGAGFYADRGDSRGIDCKKLK